MEFPIYDTVEYAVPQSVLHALGIDIVLNIRFSPKNKIILFQIEDAGVLANLKPDFWALANSYQGINGILVTAKSNNEFYDFHYRYFWPWAGTNEDPVTGGVQTFLTMYWAEKLGKNSFNCFQSSIRTSTMSTELTNEKVLISGEAIIVFEGEIKL